jgi:NADH-quinone oxidoreductase subunit N
MIYGFSGTTNFTTLATLYSTGQDAIPVTVIFGFILVITAMFFKISAAPFHMWAPDVYEGSATIVATFFATVAKFASLIVLVRLFTNIMVTWNGMSKILIFVALVSLAVGSFGAIWQKNLKRLLAYSSIGHVGFILLGLASLDKVGFKASVFYIVIYAILSLGSFGFLNLIKSSDEKKYDNEDDAENEKIFAISSLSGLSRTNPVIAFSLAILMFSTAGIPPLAGFFSKFYVIMAALRGGFAIPAILAVLFSVISAYYYLKIVKIMYFDEPKSAMTIDNISNIKFIILVTALLNLVFILFLNQSLISIGNFLDLQ